MLTTILTALTPLISGAMGYIMKFNAINAERRNQQFEMMIKGLSASTEAADSAAKREKSILGSYVRAIISIVLVGLVGAIAVGGMFGVFDINVPIHHPESSFLIFKKAAYTTYETLRGVVALPELITAFLSMIFFWFGAGQARGSR